MSAQLGEDVEELTFSKLNRMEGVPTREIARSIASNQSLIDVVIDRELSTTDSPLIYEAIHRNGNIRTLTLVGVNPMVVGRFLPQMRNLLELYFGKTVAPPAPLRLELNRNLQKVILSFANGMGDTVAEAVARVLRFRSCLTEILLCDCDLSNDGILSIGRSLQCHSMVTKVHVLEYNLVVEHEAAAEFARGIETNTVVGQLHFGVRRVHPAGWERIIRALTVNVTLDKVHLFLGQLDREGWFVLARLLAESTTQRKFCICGWSVDIYPSFVDQAMRTFCLTRMDSDDLQNVCDALASYDAVDNLVLHNGELTAEGILSIRRMLANNAALRSLGFHQLRIDDSSFGALFEFLKQSQSLGSLVLPSRPIGALNIVASSQMIKKLSLSNNNLGDTGFGALGRALKHNVSLEELKVTEQDNVTESGVRALLDGIRVHEGLKVVVIEPLSSTSQQDELEFYLDRNNHAKSILNANLPLSIWPRVLKRADECRLVDRGLRSERLRAPDMLHYFVKEKCDLFTRGPSSQKRKRNARGLASRKQRRKNA